MRRMSLPNLSGSIPLLFAAFLGFGQGKTDSLLTDASLNKVVEYALVHQPSYQQALVDREIANQTIAGKLADWYPQINLSASYQHNFILQQSIIGGNLIRFGVDNISSSQLTATQNIFNRDVVLASSTASKVRTQIDQTIGRARLDLVVGVTKAFYDVLSNMQQIKVGEETIVRLSRSLRDAQNRYNSGVSDKTDYQRAMISLANANATLTANKEALKFRKEFLKAQIGYPVGSELNIQYDTLQMESEIGLDTLATIDFDANIDYRIMFINRELQKANVKYNYWSLIPSVNLFGAYNINFQNNDFEQLYVNKYPYSFAGISFSVPVFQGLKRTHKIQEQKWVLQRMDWDMIKLRNSLNTDYARALASYKGFLTAYYALKENVSLAREVYNIIQYQYRNGVRPYIDVITAETDLRTARINYFNALNAVLASKMDVLRALGKTN